MQQQGQRMACQVCLAGLAAPAYQAAPPESQFEVLSEESWQAYLACYPASVSASASGGV